MNEQRKGPAGATVLVAMHRITAKRNRNQYINCNLHRQFHSLHFE